MCYPTDTWSDLSPMDICSETVMRDAEISPHIEPLYVNSPKSKHRTGTRVTSLGHFQHPQSLACFWPLIGGRIIKKEKRGMSEEQNLLQCP